MLEGDEVPADGLGERIQSASHLLFLYDSLGILAGVSALKHPNDGYRSNVFRRAHAAAPPESYPVELGWVVVKEDLSLDIIPYRLIPRAFGLIKEGV